MSTRIERDESNGEGGGYLLDHGLIPGRLHLAPSWITTVFLDRRTVRGKRQYRFHGHTKRKTGHTLIFGPPHSFMANLLTPLILQTFIIIVYFSQKGLDGDIRTRITTLHFHHPSSQSFPTIFLPLHFTAHEGREQELTSHVPPSDLPFAELAGCGLGWMGVLVTGAPTYSYSVFAWALGLGGRASTAVPAESSLPYQGSVFIDHSMIIWWRKRRKQ